MAPPAALSPAEPRPQQAVAAPATVLDLHGGFASRRDVQLRRVAFESCEAMVGTTNPVPGSRESDGVVRGGGTVTGGEASRVGSFLFTLRKPTE